MLPLLMHGPQGLCIQCGYSVCVHNMVLCRVQQHIAQYGAVQRGVGLLLGRQPSWAAYMLASSVPQHTWSMQTGKQNVSRSCECGMQSSCKWQRPALPRQVKLCVKSVFAVEGAKTLA